MVEKKCFLCYHVLREERKSFFRYMPGLMGNRRERGKRENNAQERSSYPSPGLVSVFVVLVFGVLTLDLRITVNSRKQKEVNPRIFGAWLQVQMHHYPGRGKSKRRTNDSVQVRMCYVGGTKPTQRYGKRIAFVRSIGFRPMVHEPAPPG